MGKLTKKEQEDADNLKKALDDYDEQQRATVKALGKANKEGDAETAGKLAAKYRGDDGQYHI